jgi:hypothetical protein
MARRLLICRDWGLQFETGAAGTMYFQPGGVIFLTSSNKAVWWAEEAPRAIACFQKRLQSLDAVAA